MAPYQGSDRHSDISFFKGFGGDVMRMSFQDTDISCKVADNNQWAVLVQT